MLETNEYLEKRGVEARAMSRLRALAMAAAAIGASVQEPEITLVVLENEQELSKAGVRTPLLNGGLRIEFDILAPDVDEATLGAAFHAVGALSEQEASAWERSARWLWKANSDPEPYDQFLALWISFNVLYREHKRDGEQAAIQEFLEENVATEENAQEVSALVIPDTLALLATSGLTLRTRAIADQLRDALAVQRPRRDIVVLLMLTIYAVRCAIFHEGAIAIPRDLEARLVIASRDILKVVLIYLLRRRLGVSFGRRSRGETRSAEPDVPV
jgi:hypothetical protein